MSAVRSQPPGRNARTPTALTIAGSDSGGGAGIQADLKAFARCGVHGTSAITAITAQNTVGVSAIHPVPPEMVLAQVRAVAEDIGIDAVKVGMLATALVTEAVARALDELPAGTPVVVDPVMISESGARLLEPEAERALVAEILPRASVLTPNLPEARVLAGLAPPPPRQPGEQSPEQSSEQSAPSGAGPGRASSSSTPADEQEEAERLVRSLLALGPASVVLTGGHRHRATDLFLTGAGDGQIVSISGERHPPGATHGSGCTHSSVLAAQLALGRTPLEAARIARALAGAAVADGLRELGAGAGPVDVLGLARMRSP
jgi:hydroxymethylpyrimidine/phosphomethylpyrimidine kinase